MEKSICEKEIGYEIIPMSYHVLLKPVTETTFGVFIPESCVGDQAKNFSVAQVLGVGDLAFVDKNTERKCEVGDYVIYNKLRRESLVVVDTRQKNKKHQLFFINDDQVRSVISKDYAVYQAAYA